MVTRREGYRERKREKRGTEIEIERKREARYHLIQKDKKDPKRHGDRAAMKKEGGERRKESLEDRRRGLIRSATGLRKTSG